ncbi:uncharacterized protein cubi_00720 [Cryptosporidium ubiquitum]|uniref:Uncharacterized protein n=1 Tax=Cryptosporidium ubiquitum TaxID=857276 RepID=A0A1J4MCF1_9CRYT|nr:uncharacterized protein cubi_00720 [Cryptosporidium ubiquitum]OII71912.1 hypothetical protein cubi_00720 [Cryptosporidium ubiquitum]
MHAKLMSSQILFTALLLISIICEVGCIVNFLDFFKKFEEDLGQNKLITDQCSTTKQEEKLKCYWGILENELIHLLRAAKSDSYGIFGFNGTTKTLIFLRRLIDLTSKTPKLKTNKRFEAYQNHQYLNNSLIDAHDIRWYNYYELEDVERIVNRLANLDLVNYGIVNFRNENSPFGNNSKKLTIKLIILSILYKQYSMDKLNYKKTIKDNHSQKNYTRNLLKAFNTEMAILEQDIGSLIKKSEVYREKKKTMNSFIKKLTFLMKYIKSEIIIFLDKTSNLFDSIKKKLYSRILNYYLWLIILAKLFFIFSRKLISMILLFDHIIIFILDNFEDYLFMLISLQFTFEMAFTFIQEIYSALISLN